MPQSTIPGAIFAKDGKFLVKTKSYVSIDEFIYASIRVGDVSMKTFIIAEAVLIMLDVLIQH